MKVTSYYFHLSFLFRFSPSITLRLPVFSTASQLCILYCAVGRLRSFPETQTRPCGKKTSASGSRMGFCFCQSKPCILKLVRLLYALTEFCSDSGYFVIKALKYLFILFCTEWWYSFSQESLQTFRTSGQSTVDCAEFCQTAKTLHACQCTEIFFMGRFVTVCYKYGNSHPNFGEFNLCRINQRPDCNVASFSATHIKNLRAVSRKLTKSLMSTRDVICDLADSLTGDARRHLRGS